MAYSTEKINRALCQFVGQELDFFVDHNHTVLLENRIVGMGYCVMNISLPDIHFCDIQNTEGKSISKSWNKSKIIAINNTIFEFIQTMGLNKF